MRYAALTCESWSLWQTYEIEWLTPIKKMFIVCTACPTWVSGDDLQLFRDPHADGIYSSLGNHQNRDRDQRNCPLAVLIPPGLLIYNRLWHSLRLACTLWWLDTCIYYIMFTMMRLVSIFTHVIFSVMVRIFKIFSHSYIQVYNWVLLTMVTLLCIRF